MLTIFDHTAGVTISGVSMFSTGSVTVHISADDVAGFVRSLSANADPVYCTFSHMIFEDFISVECKSSGKTTVTYIVRES
jgi:uncharacterized protein YqkB